MVGTGLTVREIATRLESFGSAVADSASGSPESTHDASRNNTDCSLDRVYGPYCIAGWIGSRLIAFVRSRPVLKLHVILPPLILPTRQAGFLS